ncbi:helix-turn-helix domain-containing protein [Streptomyces tendae]|uniref:helix-turn-helix domain-containing protein n=1 Tax=Streptomyces tendae TaxID=1932 RepID=UPI001E4680B5|nr:helix-turn-helix domain-containing protein [Streptomyces tendae]
MRHVRAVAETVGVSERTVWRWLERARATGWVRRRSGRGAWCRARCGSCWVRRGECLGAEASAGGWRW